MEGKAELEDIPLIIEQKTRDHRLTHVLGKGAYKITYNGTHERWGQDHAVKIISLSPRGRQILEAKGLTAEEIMAREDQRCAAIREYGFDMGINGLQSFRYSYTESDKLVIVEKKLDKTFLEIVEAYEKEHGHVMPWKIAYGYIHDMAQLLKFLHLREDRIFPSGYYHGDFALKNLMLAHREFHKDFGARNAEPIAYLTDYGTFSALCDTMSIHYRAPELFPWHHNPVDPFGHDVEVLKRADIWSLGIGTWRILAGEEPFHVEGAEKPMDGGSVSYEQYVRKREAYERAYYDVVMGTQLDCEDDIRRSTMFDRAIEARSKVNEVGNWEEAFGSFLVRLVYIMLAKDPQKREPWKQFPNFFESLRRCSGILGYDDYDES